LVDSRALGGASSWFEVAVESLPNLTSGNPYLSEEYFQLLLRKAVSAGASDVHLKVGQPPGARVRGELVYFRVDRLGPASTLAMASHVLAGQRDARELESLTNYDGSYEVDGLARFRVNLYRQRGSIAVVMRVIPFRVPTLAEISAPPVCASLVERERGLVLCVGAAGQGKTTTVAAMIDHLNRSVARHVITIEDPVEYVHEDDRCAISQREIGRDTPSFAVALRAALRQDPDLIFVGEIRDAETMETALRAAETGHLVLSTLHTPDVLRTVHRVISLADGTGGDTRERLADALQGIVAQRLLPRVDGEGVVLATEVLVGTGSVRESIKRPQGNPPLRELMEQGGSLYGMQTFETCVRELVRIGWVERDSMRTHASF
jgi:twitching motility protein PilT